MKKIFQLLFILCLLIRIASAQSPDIQWTRCLGGADWEEAYSVAQSSDSGFVVAGYRSSNDGDCSTCIVGSGHMFVVKLDKEGVPEWKKCYGGTTGEEVQSIKAVSSGGYILTGGTSSNDGDVTSNHGWIDYWVVKIDATGNIEWQKCFGGSKNDQPQDINETLDGGYIITGETNSDDGDVTGHHGVGLNYDYWVVKISVTGEIEWEKALGGSDNDWCQSIVQLPDSGYVCSGYSESDDGDLGAVHLSYDYWFVKLDSEGDIIWQKSYGSSAGDYAYSTTYKLDYTHILSAGEAHSDDEDISFYHGGVSDVWIVDLDTLGFLKWEKTFGGTSTDWAYSIIETIDTSFIICGGSLSIDGDLSDNNDMGGIWAFSIDSLGVLKWEKALGGSNIENSFEIVEAFDQGSVVVGYTMSNDGDVSGNHGGRDMWVVKLAKSCEQSKYFADLDGDLFGDASNYIYSCNDTIGFVSNNLDCNDLNEYVYPGVIDGCNNYDDDCDGQFDEDAIFIYWYLDSDGDGFGDENIDSLSCFELFGYVFDSTDCDDAQFIINPVAMEICNNLDDDCNTLVDEGIDYFVYYQDMDGDLFGNINIDSIWCTSITGYVFDSTDCDDTNDLIYPGAPELLNGLDDDCDQIIDEGLSVSDSPQNIISVYPNPTEAIITISSERGGQIQLMLTNLIGQECSFKLITIESGTIVIDLSDIDSGIYFLIIEGETNATFKIIKI